MPTIGSILNEIYTNATDGELCGSVDRSTVAELMEIKDRFPESLQEISLQIGENMEKNYA